MNESSSSRRRVEWNWADSPAPISSEPFPAANGESEAKRSAPEPPLTASEQNADPLGLADGAEPGSSRRELASIPSNSDLDSHARSLALAKLANPEDPTVISKPSPAVSPEPSRRTTPLELGQSLIGEKLNHFELLSFVGGGGMGAVFRALDTMLNREVALKVLSRDRSADEETRRRFQNEAQSAARLDHENIARVYYVGEDRGLNYIVFEFIEGVNLKELVERKGPLPLAEAIGYTIQVAEALGHASGRDVVHRDIKPSNVIVTSDGRAKLVDMGLARWRQVDREGADLTASGVTLGTFDYISPEQAYDPRVADVRSDIYSLGCTLYFTLTGKPPFPEGTVLQKLLQHKSETPPDPREFDPRLPDELATILARMLAKDPRDRQQTSRELIDQLQRLADSLGDSGWGGRRSANFRRETRPASLLSRNLPWMAPVAALLALVFCLDQFGARSRPMDEALAQPPKRTSTIERSNEGAAPDRATKQGSTSAANANGKLTGSDSNGKNPEKNTSPRDSKSRSPTKGLEASDDGLDASKRNGAEPSPKRTPKNAPSTQDVKAEEHQTNSKSNPKDGSATSGAKSASSPNNDRATTSGAQKGTNPPRARADSEEGITASNDGSRLKPFIEPIPTREGAIAAKSLGSPTETVDGSIDLDPPGSGAPREMSEFSPRREPDLAGSNDSALPMPLETLGLLIVGDVEFGSNSYPNLRAACAMAKDNDVIELRYNGRRDERPIVLNNSRITIRAATGFRPVIAFRPDKPDPAEYPKSMVTVVGGELKLVNLTLQLDVPREIPSLRWTLIESQLAKQIVLDTCLLTARNASDSLAAYHQDVAFFRVKGVPGADSMMLSEGMTTPPVEFRLLNCALRGEATALSLHDSQPARLVWQNGMLATTERLLHVQGSSATPLPGAAARVELNHLTLLVKGGLIRIAAATDARNLLETSVKLENSIVSVADAPLIEQRGFASEASLQQQFRWQGDRDFYLGCSVFWRIADQSSARPPLSMTFGSWRTHWTDARESNPTFAGVIWKTPPAADTPLHDRTPRDFQLADAMTNHPARRGASDGRDAGMDVNLLPSMGSERPRVP